MATGAFIGAKVAILHGGGVVTILRDDLPGLDWAGYWDLPGGGREGGETPEDCVLREVREELGLMLVPEALGWGQAFEGPRGVGWFFVAELARFDARAVRFGGEGQGWRLAPVEWFLSEARAVPFLVERLGIYLAEKADSEAESG